MYGVPQTVHIIKQKEWSRSRLLAQRVCTDMSDEVIPAFTVADVNTIKIDYKFRANYHISCDLYFA